MPLCLLRLQLICSPGDWLSWRSNRLLFDWGDFRKYFAVARLRRPAGRGIARLNRQIEQHPGGVAKNSRRFAGTAGAADVCDENRRGEEIGRRLTKVAGATARKSFHLAPRRKGAKSQSSAIGALNNQVEKERGGLRESFRPRVSGEADYTR